MQLIEKLAKISLVFPQIIALVERSDLFHILRQDTLTKDSV